MALDCVLSIGAKLAEYLIDPIARQFGYLIYYKSNLEDLRDQVNKLDERRRTVQLSVNEANRKGEVIGPDVDGWMTRVDGSSNEANGILEEGQTNKGCLNGWCPNLKSRHSLSRKAKKKVEEVAKLREDGYFTQVSYPAPPPGIESRPTEGIKGFESRSLILKEVMEALKEDGINMIGICGMGGVGKTTLAKEVAKRVKEEKLFDEVMMATVTQNFEVRKIQGEIADMVGFTFVQESETGRADALRGQLRLKKRILVILDDVWKSLELKDIGIPFSNAGTGCKILVTSRSEEVCNDMGAQKIFPVQVLDNEEAWNLFKEMAAIPQDDTNFQSTKMAVANECGGLPIAIVTVARALKGKGKSSWDSALEQLRKSIGKNVRGVEDKVFNSLELSFSFLKSKEAQRCFLLCSLYSEDYDIPIEDLVRYGYGCELFEGINSVGEARARVNDNVDHLKKCFLLMEGTRDEYVKMHDVVRDVAISIASREEHSFMVNCDEALKEWPENKRRGNYRVISMRCTGMRGGLPNNLEFPRLQLLQLESNHRFFIESPQSLYQGMKELKVVALARMSIPSLPTSLPCLTNLQTLSLSDCKLFGADLSVIGALKNLEILSFAGSHIREFPREICNLTRLKLLDLWYCNEIESVRIPHGVLSSLSKLEELYLGLSFMEWDVVEEGKDMILTNACVAELASLPNLVALDIYVPIIESWVWPRDQVFVLGNIRAFHICFGKSSCDYLGVPKYPPTNRLELLDIDISRGVKEIVGLEMLLKITRFLFLDSVSAPGVKFSISDLDKDGFEHLSELQVEDCSDLECLVNASDGHLAKEAFGALKTLYLSDLPQLMHLWKGPAQLACLRNLMSVSVSQCPKLKHCVFPLAIVRNLVQLQSIMIKFCDTLDVIVSDIGGGGEHEIAAAAAEEEEEDNIEFPKLTLLEFSHLQNFTSFCKPINAIKLPLLKELKLGRIPKINYLWRATETNNETAIGSVFNKDTLSSIESFNVSSMDNLVEIWPVDLEAKLRAIMVSHCHKLSNILFPSNLIECMQNLGSLKVNYCDSVEVVFDLSGLNVGGKGEEPMGIALPCLVDLDLSNLQDLTRVWANDTPAIQGFQNLRSITINGCDSLRILLSPFVAKLLENLQELRIWSCKVMEAIIGWGQEADDGMTTSTTIIFPKLTSLELKELPLLTSFCPQACTFQGSHLERVFISDCPAMESLPSAVQRMIDKQQ